MTPRFAYRLKLALRTTALIALILPVGLSLPAQDALAQADGAAKLKADASTELDPAYFKWKTTPAALQAALDQRLPAQGRRGYAKMTRTLSLNGTTWQQFFVFYHDELIAQGYERKETLVKPRVGSISDVVSYDNNHKAAALLTKKFGKPAFQDVRTRKEYSQEMGDDSLRARRSLEWDLYGERYRWELPNGTVRYTVQYSMDGLAEHRIVNVNPGKWAHYFDFMTGQAFRQAGRQRIRGFRERASSWVTAQFNAGGELKVTRHQQTSSGKPKPAERTQQTSNRCTVAGKPCVMTYYYYGRALYQVDVDFSQQGEFPRRGRHADLGKGFYTHFDAVNKGLMRQFGTPQDSQVIKNMDNPREARKAVDLVHGQEGFWSVWYEPASDTLIRHVITGQDNGGTGYHIDHTISYRFHHVARALAERDAWEAETQHISSK